jgi:hypothetical protein
VKATAAACTSHFTCSQDLHRLLYSVEEMHSPAAPSNDTSSMSDVTDMRCAARRGDEPDAASPFDVSALLSVSVGTPGTSGTGESALLSCAVEGEESRLARSDREREACESGRGVISDASSKLSCGSACDQQMSMIPPHHTNYMSMYSPLPGLSYASSSVCC